MKYIGTWMVWFLAVVLAASAQQEPQYSQFMYNKLPLNAAYTGGRDVLSVRALYRNQWAGLDGAPQTATLSVHSPLRNEDIALGFNLVHDRLGSIHQTWFSMTYAYRIPLDNGMKVSIGMNAGLLYHVNRLAGLDVNDPADEALQDVRRVAPDIGMGVYVYHPDWFYAGLSVPNVVSSDLISQERAGQAELTDGSFAQRTQHLVVIAGGIFALGTPTVKMRPQVLFKHVVRADYGSPFSMDFNVSWLFAERVNAGLGYRTSFGRRESPERLKNAAEISGMLEIWATRQLLIGYAYDHPLTGLSQVSKGSHEIIIGFDFNFDKKRIITPRYF